MKKLLLTITTICCTLTACAPSLSRTIDAPELPTANLKSTQTARPGSSISILSVEDTRQTPSSDAAEDFTEPFGGVPAFVENTIREGFQNSSSH